MTRVDITYPGDTITKSITALVRQPVSPASTPPIDIGLVEISTPAIQVPGPPGPPGPGVTVSDTPPPNPVDGDLWWESDTGKLFIRYNDGDSAQWVEVGAGSGSGGDTLVTATGGETHTLADWMAVIQPIENFNGPAGGDAHNIFSAPGTGQVLDLRQGTAAAPEATGSLGALIKATRTYKYTAAAGAGDNATNFTSIIGHGYGLDGHKGQPVGVMGVAESVSATPDEGGKTGAISEASIRDDSSAPISIDIRGTHTYAFDASQSTVNTVLVAPNNTTILRAMNGANNSAHALLLYNVSNALIVGASASSIFMSCDTGMAEGKNITVGTTTGTKIGTSTSSKLGFFNATPVIRQTVGAALSTGGAETNTNLATRINELRTALVNLGFVA
jgi:hypothetical protein